MLLPLRDVGVVCRRGEFNGVGHGTTNLFAALNVNTGEVIGDCVPARNGPAFLAFLKNAVAPHAGREIHVVLDNDILAKVRLTQLNIKKLVANNSK